ncbi:MAG: DUF115 domain-containing protein [Thermoplasmatales archaeon]|nr:MAG: DUF115 domain-containing protein [Thermoplasmatales archaeon]
MFYKDWESIYKKIAKDFNFRLENEKKAVDVFDKLLYKKQLFPLEKLEEIINDKEVVIFGAGPSLNDSINLNIKKIKNLVKISADGATSALLKKNIFPDIIVTDLDGNVSDQIKANSDGSILIIHAHGDNISEIKKYLPKLKKGIIGSTQINPLSYKNINNFGGFTDGDRAVFLASHFNAKKIFLIGFDFEGRIGKYSNIENKDLNLKLRKLNWCKYLIEFLIDKKKNIYFL